MPRYGTSCKATGCTAWMGTWTPAMAECFLRVPYSKEATPPFHPTFVAQYIDHMAALCNPGDVFYAILVIMHQYFTRFGSYCISILRDLGHNASVFYAIRVILHQFLRRDARSASSSVPFARKSRKINEKSRKITIFAKTRKNSSVFFVFS